QGSERAGGRTTGSWLLPRTGVLSAGDPQRQSGLAPGTDPPGSPESRRVQRVRARVAQGPGTDAEVHAAGHGQEPGPAAFQPRFSRSVPFVEWRDFESGAGLFSHLEGTP